jgi:hypothetical protein
MSGAAQDKTRILVYAIGGTGAKCAEAMVHLTAAGLINTDWTLRIVDQDRDNGNGTRLVRLVGVYQEVFASLRNGSQPLGTDSAFMRARIAGGERIMAVLPDIDAILRDAFNVGEAADPLTDGNALLLNALFTRDEHGERLVRGFAGRPGLGAAAFLCPPSEEQSEVWTCIHADVQRVANGEIDRILLLGSMFGGTGAAGLPTLGRHFRSRIRGRNVALGAVLMLRYFDLLDAGRFKPADHSRTRAALTYYAREMAPDGNSALFDQLYVVGLHPETVIPAEMAGGGKGQINPGLLPELIAGLGGAQFFLDTRSERDVQTSRRAIFVCGRDKPDVVTWDDLPIADLQTGPNDPRDLLIGLARFAVAYVYAFHCGMRFSGIPHLEDLPAYLRFLDIAAVREGHLDQEGERLVRLCEIFLEWFGACNLMSAPGLRMQLADVAQLVTSAEQPRPEEPKVVLTCSAADIAAGKRAALRQIKRAYRGLQRNGRGYQLHSVAAGMLASPLPVTPGFSRFVGALYSSAACLPRTSKELGAT